jgi:hypothetical protein
MMLCLSIPGLPQRLTLGGMGGLRLTGDTPPFQLAASNSRRYVVGPMIELGLPFHFAFEADALYSRLGNTFYIPLIANESDIRTIANSWTFPLLLKYPLPERRIRPFVSAGIAPRHAGGSIHSIHYGYSPGDVSFFSADWHAHDHALVFAGGIDVAFGHVRISPQLRYLRWNAPSPPSPYQTAYYLQPGRNNEAQLLVGIGWASR